MVYRKKYNRKGKKKFYRRKWKRNYRSKNHFRHKVHYIKRKWRQELNIVSGLGAPTDFCKSFQLADLPNYTEFTALYDQYKICAVKMEIRPGFNTISVTESAPGSFDMAAGMVYHVLDYNDSNTLGSVNNALEYENCRVSSMLKPFKRYFKPKFQTMLYETLTGTGYKASSGWINTAEVNVPHYAFKSIWDSHFNDNLGNIVYFVTYTYYMKFKQVK